MYAHNADTKWTSDRIAELTQLIEVENKSAGQAAAFFNANGFPFTRNSVIGKMNRLGLKSHYTARRPFVPKPPKVPRVPRIKMPKLATDNRTELEKYPDAPEPLRTSILDLTSVQCRWPLEDKDTHGLALFCGHFAAEGRYCPHHNARSISQVPRRRA